MSNLPIVTYRQMVYSAKIMAHSHRGYGMSDSTMAVECWATRRTRLDVVESFVLFEKLPTNGHAIAGWLGY